MEIKLLIERIKKQMDLVPDYPNVYERGLYDAYLNCMNWAKEIEQKSLNVNETNFTLVNTNSYNGCNIFFEDSIDEKLCRYCGRDKSSHSFI